MQYSWYLVSSRRSYLEVTVHWIRNELLQCTACIKFNGAPTYDYVAEMIADIHSEYNLKLSKIVKTVTINNSNMGKPFEIFGNPKTVENVEYISHE